MKIMIFAYGLGRSQTSVKALAKAAQDRAAGAPLTVFHDDEGTFNVPWQQRPQGSMLARSLGPGDTLMAFRVLDLLSAQEDPTDTLRRLEALRVRLEILHPCRITIDQRITWETAIATAGTLAAWRWDRRSHAVRIGMAKKRASGQRYCRWPGYGRKWAQDGSTKADEQEQATIRQITGLREAGHSWRGIANHLRNHGVMTPMGVPWSEYRVRRACLAGYWVSD